MSRDSVSAHAPELHPTGHRVIQLRLVWRRLQAKTGNPQFESGDHSLNDGLRSEFAADVTLVS